MRHTYPVAVHVFLLRAGEILLLRRFNTGYEDGNYSVVAGHVEAGETVTQAAIREAREEVGIEIAPADLRIGHVMHRHGDDERVDFFVVVEQWEGDLRNCEPSKCDELRWCAVATLPDNTIPYVCHALTCWQAGRLYSEFGWPARETRALLG